MKIHYISCHSVLEYDEVKLFTELGHDVFSNGAYTNPAGAYTLPRPEIPDAKYFPEYEELARTTPRTDLPLELIQPFDAIIIMHSPDVLLQNWHKIKHKRVIWRTIGQSLAGLESRIKPLVDEGLEIVRYSPKERNLINYAGEKALIRFYKDPSEFQGWTGVDQDVVNFTQTLKGRREFCHYDEIMPVIERFNGKVYGTGNEDLGQFNGGELPYKLQKEKLRRSFATVYGGTYPASYTLSFIEALMTGMPIVAIGKKRAHIDRFEQFDFYEVDEIIKHGTNGFISNNADDTIQIIESLLNDLPKAKEISRSARETAIYHFGKEHIKKLWKDFLK
jgi:hypothetical protein